MELAVVQPVIIAVGHNLYFYFSNVEGNYLFLLSMIKQTL